MKVTYNWLKDFVEIGISPPLLADKLTMAGLEVTSLEKKDGDFVFEIEVTSNRPDCLSVTGIAREVAAITGRKLKLDTGSWILDPGKNKDLASRIQHPKLEIKIEDKKDCLLYTAKIIKDVKVTESPNWLKKRLDLVGCRSVNSVVDITNYVLFEWGQPLHAFDLDKLSGAKIVIQRSKGNEEIITIDGEMRRLDKNILVIADTRQPIAIAGIMGGKNTEVTKDTKNVLLEAAIFNPVIVRRGRQRLGIQSESSFRFERGVDLNMLELACLRAIELIQKTNGGRCVLAKSSIRPKKKTKSINLSVSFVHKILGIDIGSPRIKKILNNLGFGVRKKTENNLLVVIPSYRQDVDLEIDLIEEIARIFGYGHIPKTLPALIPQISGDNIRGLVSLVKNILVGLGLNEVITYSLMDKDLYKDSKAGWGAQAIIEILNPLSKDQAVLRPTLTFSLAKCIAYNLNQQQEPINIFEIAKIFKQSRGQPQEELVLGIALCGLKSLLVSETQGLVKTRIGFLNLKGIIEALFKRLGIKDYCFNTQTNTDEVSVYVHKQKIGIMTRLKENILDKLDIKNKEVWLAELALDRLFSYVDLKRRFRSLTKYPGISRDISFILKEDTPLDEVLEAIRTEGGPLLCEVKIVDYYKGRQIPEGSYGITISCLYRSDERTLTELEVEPIRGLISKILQERFHTQIRNA